ncbi:1-acyl-sn-glycerol-3-phosphate acyltransferase [Caloramator fervidus]|uniref:1-acyl-sn-glycerol-3-phosphate acyltransferase n=1 Tax=Caloramator fervidus TaxID=29344 RepID=A0A1H5SJV4_9CLOT|nr:lysophospholipid acyltransferase family protein [Caloramator fervidus]SEF50795.1 1-acyl-sn-glycerol-3-phosphate acyltransferase [Caloramator fervidus]
MNKEFLGKLLFSLPKGIYKPICKLIVEFTLQKYADIEVKNYQNLASMSKPLIFVANHLSNADGLILNKVLREFDPYFVAGIKLQSKALSRIGVEAVNTITIQPNSPDLEAIKRSINVIKEGHSLMIFPEGTRSRTATMIKGKKGVILIARKCNVPIVPIGLIGTEKLMPINDEDMGKEKFYKSKVIVNIGKPFNLPEMLDGMTKDEYDEYCLDYLMRKIAELLPLEYRGVYR